MNHGLAVACLLLVSACAAVPTAEPQLLDDSLFAPPSERIDSRDVFALSAPMREYLRANADLLAEKGPQQGLFDALYARSQLKLDYDSAVTRTASQAFDARAGNCLSLVIMTAALARELGLEVRYQRVVSEDMWSRSGETYFASGHVNVTLARQHRDPRVRFDEKQALTIDFIPPKPNTFPRTWEVAEKSIVAMFMNNRAAEAFAAGRIDDAYWWVREAIRQDPTFLSAYNTLGVIYRHHGNLAHAERVLGHVLANEPGSANAMQNLALVYNDQGREAEADALTQRLERMQPYPPFHFFELGIEAMHAGDFRTAKAMFAREVQRDAYYHEFHFWLAAACLRLGEGDCAREHLAAAAENSPTRGDRDLYAAKLHRLKAR